MESRGPRLVVLQLEDLAGGAAAAGPGTGPVGSARQRVLAAGHRRPRQYLAARDCRPVRPGPQFPGGGARRPGAPRLAAPRAQPARPPHALGAAHRGRRPLVHPGAATRPARRDAAVGGAFRGPTAPVGGRHAQIGNDFEMTRDAMKPFGSIVLLTVLAGAGSAFAQSSSGGGSPAVVLPASGRNNRGGSVGAAEQPVPGTTTSVNTMNPSVQISGPYSGSIRGTTAMPFSGKLSLQEALQRGLAYNLGAVGLAQTVRQTGAQVTVARSALLPNINGNLSETVEQTNLAALGLRINVPGFHITTVAGPFNYFTLQASLTQTVANLTALNNYRSAQAPARASQYSLQNARDLITLAVGGAYLQVLAAQARVDAAQTQLDTANAVFH